MGAIAARCGGWVAATPIWLNPEKEMPTMPTTPLLTHGWGKMFGDLGGFIDGVAQMGFPAPTVMGFLAAFAESIGAILLAVGLLTRPAAFLIAATMAGAALKVHAGQGFAAQEMAWLYFVPALFFLLKGAGKWSLDALVAKKLG